MEVVGPLPFFEHLHPLLAKKIAAKQGEVLAKTPGLYQVPKQRNTNFKKIQNFGTDGPTDGQTEGPILSADCG